ncbi:MAG: type II toxin-antitoxin system RelE/ParE family toxin [Chthoniobacter sp.]
MSARYVLTAEAIDGLREIWAFIGIESQNPSAADALWADMERACAQLARKPSLGHRRKDLTPDPEVMFYCVRDFYLVIYRKGTDPLQIARILHGARDVAAELEE